MSETLPYARLLFKNYGLGASSWDASSKVATLPPANLADPGRQRVWRSTGLGAPDWIRAILSTASSVDGVALVTHNLTTAATVTVKGNTSDTGWGAPAFSQAFPIGPSCYADLNVLLLSPAGQTYKCWRLEFQDTGNSAGYYQVGVAFLGPALALGAPNDFQFSIIDPSIVGFSIGGTPKTWQLAERVEVAIPYKYQTEAFVYGSLQTMLRTGGRYSDMILSIFSCAPSTDAISRSTNLYGRLTDLSAYDYQPVNLYNWGLRQVHRGDAKLAGAMVFRESL